MATQTRSGGGLKTLVALVVVALAATWYFGSGGRGVGIYPPGGDDDETRSVVLIVRWSDPKNREVTTNYWLNGERHAGLQEESTPGLWNEWFNAPMGTHIRLLAENVSVGGRLSCWIYEGPPGQEILVREQHRVTRDLGDCDIEHRVGEPPNVEPLD